MKGKTIRMAAGILAAAVLTADVCGSSFASYAMQPKQVTSDDALPQAGMSELEQAFEAMLQEYDMYGTLIGPEISVRQQPSASAPAVQTLPSGYQVKFLGAESGEEGLWFQVAFGMDDREHTGYVQDSFVVTQDERMQQWKAKYFGGGARNAAGMSATSGKTDLSAFPSSYRSYIQKLIGAHPNWTFVPMNTGLEWADVIKNEMVDSRNLVPLNSPELWKSKDPKDYDASTGQWIIKNGTDWVQASESVVKYFIDPRNMLNEEYVFQFEQQVYNKSYHTEAGVEKILNGTFMSNKKLEDGSGGGITYARAFMKIGKELKVSPYFLASRVRQEQGVNGTSQLISGNYKGYKGYYNYFNIQATGIGEQVIISGLTEAKKEGWTTRYASLRGGAAKTADRYIYRGQDTFYLQKFDVDASYDGLYWHQYMQNLQAATNESKNVRNSYAAMGLINGGFVFKVPVYKNMPSKACPYPGEGLDTPSIKVAKGKAGVVKISWQAIGGADGCQVYRREGAEGKYKKIKTLSDPNAVSYQDKNALPGKTYYYKVRALQKLSSGNNYSSYSKAKSVNCTVPATSWNQFIVGSYSEIKLSWEKKAKLTGYKIYRKTDSGKFACIKTIKDSAKISYTDKTVLPGHQYAYRIRGYQKVNDKNYYSAYTSTMQAEIKMSVPQLKGASASGNSGIKLTWQQEPKASGYSIYRSIGSDGDFKKVKSISGNAVSSWTDGSVVPGSMYYYKIRTYVKNSLGKKNSGYSRILMVQAGNAAPAVTKVSFSAGGIQLKWAKDGSASGYQVTRATDYNGSYDSLADVSDNATVSLTDKKVDFGQTYYYKIRACHRDEAGTVTYSDWSAATGGQQKLRGTQLEKVSGVGPKAMKLKWQEVPQAAGYKLYRKDGKTGKYKLVQTISGSGKVSVTEKGLKPDTLYYYKMRTYKKVNGKMCYSPYSGEWCVRTKKGN
ncbi:MAG: SH3 domain-containing protein [Lachnospiraceae bacterium]|nr:SH3 domain-containing protein [Lachnospiraceae bacterium]